MLGINNMTTKTKKKKKKEEEEERAEEKEREREKARKTEEMRLKRDKAKQERAIKEKKERREAEFVWVFVRDTRPRDINELQEQEGGSLNGNGNGNGKDQGKGNGNGKAKNASKKASKVKGKSKGKSKGKNKNKGKSKSKHGLISIGPSSSEDKKGEQDDDEDDEIDYSILSDDEGDDIGDQSEKSEETSSEASEDDDEDDDEEEEEDEEDGDDGGARRRRGVSYGDKLLKDASRGKAIHKYRSGKNWVDPSERKAKPLIAVKADPQWNMRQLKREVCKVYKIGPSMRPTKSFSSVSASNKSSSTNPSDSEKNDSNANDSIFFSFPKGGLTGAEREVWDDDSLGLGDTELLDVSLPWRVLSMWSKNTLGGGKEKLNSNRDQIRVQSSATGLWLDLQLYLDEPVFSLKIAIRDELGVAPNELRLFVVGKSGTLDNDTIPLSTAGVTPGCTVMLTRYGRFTALEESENTAGKEAEQERRLLDLSYIAESPLQGNWSAIVARLQILSALAIHDPLNRQKQHLLAEISRTGDNAEATGNRSSVKARVNFIGKSFPKALRPGHRSSVRGRADTSSKNSSRDRGDTEASQQSSRGKKRQATLSKQIDSNAHSASAEPPADSSVSSTTKSLQQRQQQQQQQQQQRLASAIEGSDNDAYFSTFAPAAVTPDSEFSLDIWAVAPTLKPTSVSFAIPTKGSEDNLVGVGPLNLNGPIRISLMLPRKVFQVLGDDDGKDLVWSGAGLRGASFTVRCLHGAATGPILCRARVNVTGEPRAILCFKLSVQKSSQLGTGLWNPMEVPAFLTILPPRFVHPTIKTIDDAENGNGNGNENGNENASSLDNEEEQVGYDVYICYRREHRQDARDLASTLEEKLGYRVYLGDARRAMSARSVRISRHIREGRRGSRMASDLQDSNDDAYVRQSASKESAGSDKTSKSSLSKKKKKALEGDEWEDELNPNDEAILLESPIVIFLMSGKPSGVGKIRSGLSSLGVVKRFHAEGLPDRGMEELKIACDPSQKKVIIPFYYSKEVDPKRELKDLPPEFALLREGKPFEWKREDASDESLADMAVTNLEISAVSAEEATGSGAGKGKNRTQHPAYKLHTLIQERSKALQASRTPQAIETARKNWEARVAKLRKARLEDQEKRRKIVWDLDSRSTSDVISRVFSEAGAAEALALIEAGEEPRSDTKSATVLESIADGLIGIDDAAAWKLYNDSRRIMRLVSGHEGMMGFGGGMAASGNSSAQGQGNTRSLKLNKGVTKDSGTGTSTTGTNTASSSLASARTKEKLAMVCADQEEKASLLESSAQLKDEALDNEHGHPEVALAWDAAANAYAEDPDNIEIIATLRQNALEQWRSSLGHTHPLVLVMARRFGNELLQAGQAEKAREILRDTVRGQKMRLGKDHPSTKRSISLLEQVAAMGGRSEANEGTTANANNDQDDEDEDFGSRHARPELGSIIHGSVNRS